MAILLLLLLFVSPATCIYLVVKLIRIEKKVFTLCDEIDKLAFNSKSTVLEDI